MPKGSPKSSKKVPKDFPKGPQDFPRMAKGLAKGAQRLPRDLHTSPRLPQKPQRPPQWYKKVSKDLPKGPKDQAGGEYLRWFPPYPPSAGARPDEIALLDRTRPSKIDDSCVFWTHLEQFPRLVLVMYLTWPRRVPKGSPKGSKKDVLEGDFEGKGGGNT